MPKLNETGVPTRQLVPFVCDRCGRTAYKRSGCVNRSRRSGNSLYCGRECSNAARRADTRTAEQKKADKAIYDAEYRRKNAAMLKAKKAAHFRATYDPVLAAEARKLTMLRHVEYCRRPEYRAKKAAYDQIRRDTMAYGPFAACASILRQVEGEIESRITKTEIRSINGTLNKAQERKRDYARTHGNQSEVCALGEPQRDQGRDDATRPGRRHRGAGEGDPSHGEDATPGVQPVQAEHPRRPHQLRGEVKHKAQGRAASPVEEEDEEGGSDAL